MSDSNTNIKYIIKPTKRFHLGIGELWRYRELFYFFTWRDIKVKYKQTLLGFLWAILQPALMMAIFVVFFSKVLKVPTDNIPPTIFYFSGLLLWNLFSSALSNSAQSMVVNADIIKKVYFPRVIIPLSSVLVSFFDFLIASLVFIFIIIYHLWAGDLLFINNYTLLYFFIALSITIFSSAGLGTLLSSLNVKYRDFRYVIPFFIQLMMFLSPVIYPVSILQDISWLKYVLAINPLTGALDLARAGFITGMQPDWILVGISLLSAFFISAIGIFVFRKTEAYFADLA